MPINNAGAIYPATDQDFINFPSRRSVVHGCNGMVACTQPLAAQCAIKILREGGNAAVRGLNPIQLVTRSVTEILPKQ